MDNKKSNIKWYFLILIIIFVSVATPIVYFSFYYINNGKEAIIVNNSSNESIVIKTPGFHFYIPLLNKIFVINPNNRYLEIKDLNIITKDRIKIKINYVIFYSFNMIAYNITDIREINQFETNLLLSIEKLLREDAGKMSLTDYLRLIKDKRFFINKKLPLIIINKSGISKLNFKPDAIKEYERNMLKNFVILMNNKNKVTREKIVQIKSEVKSLQKIFRNQISSIQGRNELLYKLELYKDDLARYNNDTKFLNIVYSYDNYSSSISSATSFYLSTFGINPIWSP